MARVPRTNRRVYTQENYEAIIKYTRNKSFEYKSREDMIAIFQSIGVLQRTDGIGIVTELLTKLTDYGVLRAKYSRNLSNEAMYKFSGLEDRWHESRSKRVPEYLQFNSGPEADLGNFLYSAWT